MINDVNLSTEHRTEARKLNMKFNMSPIKVLLGSAQLHFSIFIINYYDNLNDETLQWHIGYNVNICEYIMTHLPNVSKVVCAHDIYVILVE